MVRGVSSAEFARDFVATCADVDHSKLHSCQLQAWFSAQEHGQKHSVETMQKRDSEVVAKLYEFRGSVEV